MYWRLFFILTFSLGLFSCSSSDKGESLDASAVVVEVEGDAEELDVVESSVSENMEEETIQDFPLEGGEDFSSEQMQVAEEQTQTTELLNMSSYGGETATYTVQKGDTLMWIANKLYNGDFLRWREIVDLNQAALAKTNGIIYPGMQLSYNLDGYNANWKKEGGSYLIKWGDTLGLISKGLYGTMKHWRGLQHHNRIENPNLIYAGFTLFYLNDPHAYGMH